MRLWTVHPRYLDSKGLVALWREALLAQKVLLGETTGYRHHPQLERFRDHPDSRAMISSYLRGVCRESVSRGYHFDVSKIRLMPECEQVEETDGQLMVEWRHLLGKLVGRSPAVHQRWLSIERPEPHPLFTIVPGPRRTWERA